METDSNNDEEIFTKTMNLRYIVGIQKIGNKEAESAFVLQQMHQGSNGTQKWECVELLIENKDENGN